MGKLIFLIAMISHVNVGNGISLHQKSSVPVLAVTPSSNSIQLSWEKLSSWSSSSQFMVSISIPDSVINIDFHCEEGPGTKCVLDTEDFSDLPACTPAAITIEASGVVSGPHITTTLSPDPLQLSVSTQERNLYIDWELPTTCEKSSKLIIKARDVILYENVFNVPENSFVYELRDEVSTCDVVEVVVRTVTSDGESRGLKNTFLYAEIKELDVKRTTSSTLNFKWEQPPCVSKTEVSWYDTFYSPSHLIGRDEVAATSYQIPTEDDQNMMLCLKPKGRFNDQWLEGGEGCIHMKDLSGAQDLPDVLVTPHITSVDVSFLRLYPWNGDVKDFNLTIHQGTDNKGTQLCSSPFHCAVLGCKINSEDYCDPLPICTDVFVEVSVNDEDSSESSTT
ncbi:unnamed protein product, partial [Meganyctiphanes norvegica]